MNAGIDLVREVFAEQQRSWRRALNASLLWKTAIETQVGSTPSEVVLNRPRFRLLRYWPKVQAAYSEPVILCYALINRPYILDLQPGKSVVEKYLQRGFAVYLIDWVPPSSADQGLALEDYVLRFVDEVVSFVADAHRIARVHLLGYCMGGTMAAIFAALGPDRVASLTLLAAPIAFDGRESLLNVWTNAPQFDIDAFIETHGNCPAWFLQGCFVLIKPVQNIFEKGATLYEQMGQVQDVSTIFAMERWINDNIPVAGETFRQFVKNLFQRDELVRGELRLGGRVVDLGRITCPVLVLTAKHDHLVAPASSEGIRRSLGSTEVESMTIGAGHVGLVVSGKAHESLWPAATNWLASRSTPVDVRSGGEPS